MALIVARALGEGQAEGQIEGQSEGATAPEEPQPLNFTDAADISAAYEGFVRIGSEYRVLRGYDDGSFGPDRHTTRREACVVIYRLIGQAE